MGYLDNTSITVDAILTKRGRELLSQGGGQAFQITQFALGDDEIDYTLFNENHPNGSQFAGEAIENMPLLEAFPDEGNIMIHKLITLNSGTSKIPLVTANVPKITLSLGASTTLTPSTINFNDINSQSEPSGYMITVADRRLFSQFGNVNNSQSMRASNVTNRAAFSQTVMVQNSVSMAALNSTSLFGTNDKLLTTITIEGRDTGARLTLPVEISRTVVGQIGVNQAIQAVSLR
tara:strand:- start:6460 stop:7161 length:702 start_codon:yes stop_codon:yes gene_type:complete